ncbi:MAG: hypothetical protein GXO76_14470 [Calditrichaeota bacterium]|nr:hypothetical protein [Calditrichota bacterium]
MINRFRKVWIWGLVLLIVGAVLAPGCGQRSPREMTVLIQGSDAYAKWLQEKLSGLGKSFGWKITVSAYFQDEDLLDMLNLEKDGRSNKMGVIEVPLELSDYLRKKKMIIPLKQAVSEEQLRQDLRMYDFSLFPEENNAQKVTFLPERGTLFLMAYFKPAVREVLRDWRLYEREFSFVMQKYNHWGLPVGYAMEKNPEKWDFYDLAFMAYYWAAKPSQGLLIPRMAHSGAPTTGTLNDLSTRAFELGASTNDLFHPLNTSVIDMFQWESLFIKEGLYNPEMWENNWLGTDLISEFLSENIFLSFFDQSQLFTLFGGLASDTLHVPLKLSEVGISTLPKGCSLLLGKNLVSERAGKKVSGFYLWSLGIPSRFRNPQLAYKVIRFITGENLQKQAMNTFGYLPSRKNILAASDSVLDRRWKREIFRVVKKQLAIGVQPFPSDFKWNKIGALYLAAWENICVEKQTTRWNAIENALKSMDNEVKQIEKTGQK